MEREQYRFYPPSILRKEAERIFTIEQDDLRISSATGPDQSIPYGKVTHVRLRHMPVKSDWDRYQCTVLTANGITLEFCNRSFEFILSPKDQSKEYVLFLACLHRVLQAANNSIVYSAGMSPTSWYVHTSIDLLLWTGIGIFLSFVAHFVLGLVFAVPWFIFIGRSAAKNRPRPYNPLDLPLSVLPKVGKQTYNRGVQHPSLPLRN